ncbi:MAG: hypothetical protein HYS43_00725, partial [Candidatus Liptonbacteria bacterium]|nr:hypothetical protein [Candidatus Liptonbacteria bacterium]
MRKKKRLLYACMGMAGVSMSLLLYMQAAVPAPMAAEREKSAIYPTQYSDAHITKNAVATDERFKGLATFSKESFLAGAAGSLRKSTQEPRAERPEKGTWLWTPTLSLTPAYWDSILAGAKKNDIQAIYLSIDTYLDIYVMPDGPEKTAKKKAFGAILENFLAAARENGMVVDAEAGWRNWAEPGNEYKASAVVDYALEFNATHAEKFRGFQYDIEPYLLPSYAENKKEVLRNFIGLVSKTLTRLDGSDLEFSIAIPDFYDGASGETPRFFYGLSYTYTLNHLLKVLERRPGSAMLVMAYRNRSEGANGSIAISEEEIRAANATRTRELVAQETGDASPPSGTFYNSSL